MQEKLSKNSTQVDLLQELLNLQKDLIVMLLSMLEGTIYYLHILSTIINKKANYNPFL